TELTPNGRFTVLQDSDEFLMLEMQHLDSEAAFMRPSPKFASEEARLDFVKAVMAKNIAAWSTAEHRRSATRTLLFHCAEPPAQLAQKIAPFEALASGVLDHLPPAVEHTRHFHWISALHLYRAQMQDGTAYMPNAAPPYPRLIEDECNAFRLYVEPQAVAAPRTAAERLKAPMRAFRDKLLPNMLERILDRGFGGPQGWRNRRLALAYFGDVPRFLQLSRPEMSLYRLDLDQAHHGDPAAEIVFSGLEAGPSPALFCLCAPLGSLSHWSKIQKCCDELLRRGSDITLVYVTAGRQLKTFDDEPWLLSRILSYFPSDRYNISVAAHSFDPLQQRYLEAIAPFRTYADIFRPTRWPALLRIAGILGSSLAAGRTIAEPPASLAETFAAISVHLAPVARHASRLDTADAAAASSATAQVAAE
ncbi:MAG: hypothetical protein ACLQJR_03370, partial [Stellaceae bacterium]